MPALLCPNFYSTKKILPGGEPHAAHFADVGGGGFLSFEERREESCVLKVGLRLRLRCGCLKYSRGTAEALLIHKIPSETDVSPKAVSGLGRDWIGNLWAGLC